MRSPVTFTILNRGMRFEGKLSTPESYTLQLLADDVSTGAITFADSHPTFAAATAKGARVICQYRGDVVLSGRLRAQAFNNTDGVTNYTIRGDRAILGKTAALVVPDGRLTPSGLGDLPQARRVGTGAPGTSEGYDGYYRFPDSVSSAESAIKKLLSDNFARSQAIRPVVVLPSRDRGGDARAAGVLAAMTTRFENLEEAIAPLLQFSGLLLDVKQNPGQAWITVDVREPDEWPQVLTKAAGVLRDAEYSIEDPEVTLALLLANGEAADRLTWAARAPGMEAEYADVLEVVYEATGGKLDWPEEVPEAERIAAWYLFDPRVPKASQDALRTYLQGQADEKLRGGAALLGASAELSETADFHVFGRDGILLGDRVKLGAPGRAPLTDRLGGATLDWNAGGFKATPVVGDGVLDEDEMIWTAIEDLRAQVRRPRRD